MAMTVGQVIIKAGDKLELGVAHDNISQSSFNAVKDFDLYQTLFDRGIDLNQSTINEKETECRRHYVENFLLSNGYIVPISVN